MVRGQAIKKGSFSWPTPRQPGQRRLKLHGGVLQLLFDGVALQGAAFRVDNANGNLSWAEDLLIVPRQMHLSKCAYRILRVALAHAASTEARLLKSSLPLLLPSSFPFYHRITVHFQKLSDLTIRFTLFGD